MRRRALPLVFGLFAAVALPGCGQAGSLLDDPRPCPTPTAFVAAPQTGGTPSSRAYFAAVNGGLEAVKRPAALFLERWPSRKFSREAAFRQDLAKASDETICVAQQLLAARPPDRFAEYDSTLDGILVSYIESMRIGREAAGERNVSKFRDWLDAVDALPAQLDELRAILSRP